MTKDINKLETELLNLVEMARQPDHESVDRFGRDNPYWNKGLEYLLGTMCWAATESAARAKDFADQRQLAADQAIEQNGVQDTKSLNLIEASNRAEEVHNAACNIREGFLQTFANVMGTPYEHQAPERTQSAKVDKLSKEQKAAIEAYNKRKAS
jgi:hypothetical protein